MKILIIGGMFPPMRTGTAFYTQNLAKALRKHGHDVEIVTLGNPDFEIIESINVHRLPALSIPIEGFFKHFRLCAWNPLNWWRLYKITKNTQPEIIILVNHYLDIAFLARFVAKICNLPLVCSVGTQLQSLNPIRDRVLNFLDKIICGKLVLSGCDRVIAWDNQIKKYLEDIHGKKILEKVNIVNYGVNGDASQLISNVHNYDNETLVLGVGAVSEQRSFIPLVQAFSLLAPKFPELKLSIIGHIYYDEAPKLAKNLGLSDRISFHGELSHDQVISHMKSSTLFYSSLTSKYVGLGTATIEAMLLGLPTVVNTPLDLLGNAAMVDKKHLIQSTSFNPNDIANAITLLLSNRDLRSTIGACGREFVINYLNWDTVALDMSQVLTDVIESRV
jgi:glycosyltransferase involved in cell wall biosynthesis